MQATTTLRILSLNTWGIVWPIGRDVNLRARAIGNHFSQLDVDLIALQEVWTEEARSIFLDAAIGAGFSHTWRGTPSDENGGLLVMSRFPIERSRFTAFELGGIAENIHHSDYWGGKGFVILDLAVPGSGTVHLLNTHLHAAYRAREEDEYIGHRTAQIIQIAAAIRDTKGPLIAVGDFNFRESFAEYGIFTKLSDVRDIASDLDARARTSMPPSAYLGMDRESNARIDYVFYRSGLRISAKAKSIEVVLDEGFEDERGRFEYSDHAGLMAELVFAKTEGAARRTTRMPRRTAQLAMQQLKRGRRAVQERQGRQRRWGMAALALPPVVYYGFPSSSINRRRFISIAAILFGATAFELSEQFRPEELDGFDKADARLAALRASLH